MHHALSDTIILLLIAVIAVLMFRRLRLPPVLAYLAVGTLLGPHATGLVANSDAITFLAEVGVAFLLFTLGLEFSLTRLNANRRAVLGLGSAQVTIGILAFGVPTWLLGHTVETAFVVGCILTLSSTAIVIKQLSEQLELDSRHGLLSVSVLLYQDIAVVPMLVIIPALSGGAGSLFLGHLAISLIEGLAVTGMMLAIGHWLLRPLFHEIAGAHSAELFTLTVLLVVLVSAWATHLVGLSMALGAFLAGMMLSETEFRHQIEADIRPFRDVLLGLFFISIGMLLDLGRLPGILHWVLLLTLAIVLVKTLTTMALGMLITHANPGVALRTGVVLAQGGEFGFALLSLALAANLIDEKLSQIVLASVIMSMMLTPLLIRYNGSLARFVYPGKYGASRDRMEEDIKNNAAGLMQHVIICGFGRIGQNIAKVIDQENCRYFALDYNIRLLRDARKAGFNVYFGDSTHQEILLAAGVQRAAVLIICHDDIATTEKTLLQARKLNAKLPVLVRTQDETYYERLQQAGATEVVPETLEASLIMASQLLSLMGMPMARIVRRVQQLRHDNYNTLREFFHGDQDLDLEKPEESRKRLTSITLQAGAYAIGKTLEQLELEKSGVTVRTNRRSAVASQQPTPGMQLKEGDVLVLFGTPESLEHAEALLLNG